MKYRIAVVDWHTAFGDVVRGPAVQIRVAFFWWVTITHCNSFEEAKTYINNMKKRKKDIFIRLYNPSKKGNK